MGSIPRVSVLSGPRRPVPAGPLTEHLSHLAASDKTALVYSDETGTFRVSYASLFSRSNALSRAITARARPQGTNRDGDYVIAVCMQPSHHTVTALLAIWKAGAAYVAIEPSFPQNRITHILNDAEPGLVIYDDSANPSMFTRSGSPAVSFEVLLQESFSLSIEDPQDTEVLAPLSTNSIAIVFYTSGSTGIPKGVRLPYSAICNRLWWQFRTFPFSDTEETCVWKTALTFGDAVAEIWGPLLHGRTLLVLSRETTRDPQKLVKVLSENQVQRLVLVPTLLRFILMYLSLNPSERPLEKLKFWVCSGETLSKDLATQFFKYFGDRNGYKLGNFYGSTEVMGDVTYYVMENEKQLEMFPTIPIGAPLDNCVVYLLDDEMNPVLESERGQIWVAGANLSAGYVGGQEADSFQDNPHADHTEFGRLYRTGDFGTLHKGLVLFAGRTDSQVKVRGNRVDLQEVDRAVAGVPGVDKCVVLCYGADRGDPEILAFVTIAPDARIAAHHIEASLKTSLTSYMIPQVIVIESVPLQFNGKVDREALLKIYENYNNNDDSEFRLKIDYSGVEPEALEAARVLFETVGEVLGRAVRGALSIRAGFFELGGNSLNCIYTITRLRDKGYYIEISDFLSAANLGEVLSCLTTCPDREHEEIELFTPEPMRNEHKQLVFDMIISSFFKRAKRKQSQEHEIEVREYANLITAVWEPLLQIGLSIVLTDATGIPVAVALNFDARDEPDKLPGGFVKIMSFLETRSVNPNLPTGKGTVLHSFLMATSELLSPRDNVSAIRALENATIRIAQEKSFHGVFTTNTSPLTQQLCRDVLGFKTLLDYQINQCVDRNGDRIFCNAPDSCRAIICWKPLE